MPAPSFRSKEHAAVTAGVNTLTVAAEPAGTVQNDVIYALIQVGRTDDTLTTITPPSGWTALNTWSWIDPGVESLLLQLCAIRRGASAPSLVWTLNANTSPGYVAAALWTWVDVPVGATLYTGTPAYTGNVTGTSPDGPSISGVTSGDVVFVCGFAGTGTTSADGATAPSGYTIRDAGTIAGSGIVCASKVSAGGTENPAVFGGFTSNNWSMCAATLNLGGAAASPDATVNITGLSAAASVKVPNAIGTIQITEAVAELISTSQAGTYDFASFTPAPNSLLVCLAFCRGSVAVGAMTTVSGTTITWTRKDSIAFNAGADTAYVFWGRAPATTAASVYRVDVTADPGTGCGAYLFQIVGATPTGDPIRQVAENIGTSANASATFGLALDTNNGYVAAWMGALSSSNPANVSAPPTSWTEIGDAGFATPTSNFSGAYRAKGETGTTVTFTHASTTWGLVAAEIIPETAPVGSVDVTVNLTGRSAAATVQPTPTVTAAASYTLIGRSAAISPGSLTTTQTANVPALGIAAAASRGNLSVSTGSDISVGVTGLSATSARGTPTVAVGISAAVTGLALAASRGTPAAYGGMLTWDAASGATSYKIYWGTTFSNYPNSFNVGNVLSYPFASLTGIARNTTYYLVVRAVNASGESATPSNEIVIWTEPVSGEALLVNPLLVPLLSGLPAAATLGSPSVNLTTIVSPTGRSAVATLGVPTVNITQANVSVNVLGLSALATLGTPAAGVFTVVPATGIGAIATVGAPIVRLGVSVAITGFGMTASLKAPSAFGGTLLWDAVPGAVSYRIYWGTTSGIYPQMVDVGNVLSYPLSLLGFSPNTSYYVIIKAWNGSLESTTVTEIQILNGGELPPPYTLAITPGRALALSRGTPSVVIPVAPAVVGRSAAATLGIPSVTTTGAALVNAIGLQATASTGLPAVQGIASTSLLGRAATASLGNTVVIADIIQSASVPLVGIGAAATLGQTSPTSPLTTSVLGFAATASRGNAVASIAVLPTVVGRQAISALGVPVVTASASTAIVGLGGTASVRAPVTQAPAVVDDVQDFPMVAQTGALSITTTVNYQAVGRLSISQFGSLTVTIAGNTSFGISGLNAVASTRVPVVVAHASTGIIGQSSTSTLGAGVSISIHATTALSGRSAAAVIGSVGVLTDAGSVAVLITGRSLTLGMPNAAVVIPSTAFLSAGFYSQVTVGLVDLSLGGRAIIQGLTSSSAIGVANVAGATTVLCPSLYAVSGLGNAIGRIDFAEDVVVTQPQLLQTGLGSVGVDVQNVIRALLVLPSQDRRWKAK